MKVTPKMIADACNVLCEAKVFTRDVDGTTVMDAMRRALEAALTAEPTPEPADPDPELVAMAEAMATASHKLRPLDYAPWAEATPAAVREMCVVTAAARLALVEAWAKEPPEAFVNAMNPLPRLGTSISDYCVRGFAALALRLRASPPDERGPR